LVYLYSSIKMMHGPINIRFHGCSFIMGTDITQFPMVQEHFFLRWIYAEALLGNECKIRS